jgi:uncharacterized membrane protein YphA (DoxX/SURF4 family)
MSTRFDRYRAAGYYARFALGAAFLSAVASRFGLWHGKFDMQSFQHFEQYTGQVNSFMPAATIPFLAWAATVCETTLGVLLIAGVWRRPVAWAAAVLLAMFATAMAISFGLKAPLDYSVYSASAAAVMLALQSEAARARAAG